MRRLRAAFGRLAIEGDDTFAAAMAAGPATAVLAAAVLAVTASGPAGRGQPLVSVPIGPDGAVGGPGGVVLLSPSGPWARAWAEAPELGVDLGPLLRQAETGTLPALLVRALWLGRGGWHALWRRAARARRDPMSICNQSVQESGSAR